MKVTTLDIAKTIGGDITGIVGGLPGFAADKAGQAWGAAKKRATATGQRANMIYETTQSTCDDRFMVMAKTAIPAAGKALWLILMPNPDEIVEEIIQPKGRRTDPRMRRDKDKRRRKGKNGKRRKRFRGIVPNVNGLVAGTIVANDAHSGRVPGKAEGAAWWAWDRAERVLYFWLILDAWDTFIYEWSSGLVEARFCANPHGWVADFSLEGDFTQNHAWWDDNTVFTDKVLKNVERSGANQIDLLGPDPVDGTCFASSSGFIEATRDLGGKVREEFKVNAFDAAGNLISQASHDVEHNVPEEHPGKIGLSPSGTLSFEGASFIRVLWRIRSLDDGFNYAYQQWSGQFQLMGDLAG